MSDLLKKEEVEELTDCKQRKSQEKWLKDNGVPFFPMCASHPRVTWTAINQVLLTPKIEQVSVTPNMDKI